ncbi:MAG: prephenate dehydrogenase [Lacibacter sp.]
MFNRVAIIGVGLIGGSFALALRKHNMAQHICGVVRSEGAGQRALQRGLVDEILPLEQAVAQADLVYISIPVDATLQVLQQVLDAIPPTTVVTDAGSTKAAICAAAAPHAQRGRFVAAHPMWGTEYSGPDAAVPDAFTGRACVICERERSDADALEKVETIYKQIGMHLVYMDAGAHDMHAAYVSHISHITSFALANTVLEKEREEETIFELAAGGFESTVRLAKSNANMWVPIFMQNREHVLDVLNEHISQLRKFKACLEKENEAYLHELIANANKIGRILK